MPQISNEQIIDTNESAFQDIPQVGLVTPLILPGGSEAENEQTQLTLLPSGDNVRSEDTSRYPAPRKENRDRGCWSSIEHLFADTWISEVLSLVFSTACLVTIAALLKVYDGRPIPDLPWGVSLNALVSVLSTGAKSAMLYTVSAVIAQAKWDWYEARYHSLLDLDHFDEASRGPLGAIRMFFKRFTCSTAAFGALVTLLALGVDPFVQQVVRYALESISTPSDQVWTQRSTSPLHHVDNDYISTMDAAVWGNGTTWQVHCDMGNCTWPPFETVEYCLESKRMTSSESVWTNCTEFTIADFVAVYRHAGGSYQRHCAIQFGSNDTTPLGYTITAEPNHLAPTNATIDWFFPWEFINTYVNNLYAVDPPHSPLWQSDSQDAMQALGYARFANDTGASFQTGSVHMQLEAVEYIVLRHCINEYQITVSQGQTLVRETNSRYGHYYLDNSTAWRGAAACWTSEPGPATFTLPPEMWEDDVLALTNASSLSFCLNASDYVNFINSGVATLYLGQLGSGYSQKFSQYNDSMVVYDSLVESNYGDGWDQDNDELLGYIRERSLGSVMQNIVGEMNSFLHSRYGERITGSFITYEAVIRIQWWWFTLPCVLQTLTIGLLLSTVYQRRRVQRLWKGSLVAVLYHGLEDHDQPSGQLDTVSAMEEAAKRTRVKLKTSKNGDRMVLGTLRL